MKQEVLWLLLGMAMVTFLPRFLPMAFLTRSGHPGKSEDWFGLHSCGYFERHRFSHSLLHGQGEGRNRASFTSCSHSGICACLQSEKPLGIGHSRHADLLGTGLYPVKLQRAGKG